MNGNRGVFGFCNTAFYPSRHAGTEVWYPTRDARDEALERFRERAGDAGLSATALRAGIYEIEARWSEVRDTIDGRHVIASDALADEVG